MSTIWDRRSTAAELETAAILIQRGHGVSWPLVRCEYDLIGDNGQRLYKLQIKTSDHLRVGELQGGYEVKIATNNTHYREGAFDYLVVKIPALSAWYIIPPAAVGKCSILVRPDYPQDDPHAQYRDAWQMLDANRKEQPSCPLDSSMAMLSGVLAN